MKTQTENYLEMLRNGGPIWRTMNFKTEKEAREFINKIQDKYSTELIFVENGFEVEYKRKKQL